MAEESQEYQIANQAFKQYISNAALHHIDEIDIRTGTMLEIAGIIERNSDAEIDASILPIISTPTHPNRIESDSGPIVFYSDNEHKNKFAIEVHKLLLNPKIELRELALSYFGSVEAKSNVEFLFKATQSKLNALHAKIIDADCQVWQPAALDAHDVLEQDLLFQLACVRQCIQGQYEDGLRSYIPRILKPELKSFSSLNECLLSPIKNAEKLQISFNDILKEKDLISACTKYLSLFGVLPRSNDMSFTRMVELWLENHKEYDDWSKELRDWSLTQPPHFRFYVTFAVLALGQESLEETSYISDLMEEMFNEPENEAPAINFWELNQKFAKHYLRHLEIHNPGFSSESIANASWWLSSKVASIFCEFSNAFSHLNKVVLEPQMQITHRAWRFANPLMIPSAVWIATHWSVSPWNIAALNLISNNSQRSSTILSQLRERKINFEQTLFQYQLFSCATLVDNSNDAKYLFELNYAEYVIRMSLLIEDETIKSFMELASENQKKLSQHVGFLEAFDQLSKDADDKVNDLFVLNISKILSFQDQLPIDALWEKLADDKWRIEVFKKLTQDEIESIFDIFSYALKRSDSKWQARLPHILALSAEEFVDNEEKANFLFALTLLSSIHTQSVSAIERLLRGKYRSQFTPIGQRWKNILFESSKTAPPWVSSRIRALTAAISSSQ